MHVRAALEGVASGTMWASVEGDGELVKTDAGARRVCLSAGGVASDVTVFLSASVLSSAARISTSVLVSANIHRFSSCFCLQLYDGRTRTQIGLKA